MSSGRFPQKLILLPSAPEEHLKVGCHVLQADTLGVVLPAASAWRWKRNLVLLPSSSF